MLPLTLIYSPFPSMDAARAAAQQLLEQKLVACCNILPATTSLYWWEGQIEQSSEVVLLAKTTPEQAANATAALATSHPYECPAILSIPANGNALFAQWLKLHASRFLASAHKGD